MDDLKPMDAEQLREYGHKMVDFIADYYKNIENFPVLSQVQVLSLTHTLDVVKINHLIDTIQTNRRSPIFFSDFEDTVNLICPKQELNHLIR